MICSGASLVKSFGGVGARWLCRCAYGSAGSLLKKPITTDAVPKTAMLPPKWAIAVLRARPDL
jgi:hypothetical protein